MAQINPYQQALGAYDLQLEDLKAKARRVQAGGATTKKIEGMKSEFSKKMSAAEGKQTAALEKAAEKAEEEQKKATDWDLVGAVRDALFKAIDWVKNLFKFDGKGISFKGLAPLVDILMFPLNAAINWVRSLFGWDKNKDGVRKKILVLVIY